MSRKLDAAIAEVLGYEVLNLRGNPYIANDSGYYGLDDLVPHYSTDGNAMLELIRCAQKEDYCLMLEVYRKNTCTQFYKFVPGTGIVYYSGYCDEHPPKAVAKAFYQAKTGKGWRDD